MPHSVCAEQANKRFRQCAAALPCTYHTQGFQRILSETLHKKDSREIAPICMALGSIYSNGGVRYT